jgi:type II secretory pathway component GspD/PulD (secretin)
MKKSLIISLMVLPFLASAGTLNQDGQGTPQTNPVSIKAKGDDVRSVLSDLFGQAKKNFVLAPGVRFVLYLGLDKVEFDEALEIVCQQANLRVEIQNGIYYITTRPAKKADAPVEKKIDTGSNTTENSAGAKVELVQPTKPKGTLPAGVLQKKVSTKLAKADIRVLFAQLGKQTGLTIEVDPAVPAYKLDAYLINTSLKYALDQITGAAKLQYKLTDNMSILITKPVEQNRVAVIDP